MTSLPATPTAAATAVVPETVSPAVPAADVTVGESSQTVSKTALVSQPSTTVAAPAKALIPAAAETPEPVVAAAVTQTIASANRMTTAPLRNQEKVVQEIKPVSQGVTLETSVSEPTVTVTNAPVSETATLDAGGNPSGNGNNSAGQNQNGQAHQMAAQQHKTEPVSATGAAPAAREMHEPSKPEPMEQHILQQVKDQLAGRDFKPGSEQMFIRLTPNNLGELTLNLKMENQQLKIDIVADKSMVRDTLLKHVDSLRETLAKQNITMESFNVSTGSNGNQSGRNQNDWRELALQRQQNAWMASGGYRTQEPAVPTLAAAYQTRPEHAMVDLHF
jgi:flagellar hook-length control protein FliK